MLRLGSVAGLILACFATIAKSETFVYPSQYSQIGDNFTPYVSNKTCITLTPSNPNITIDYGTEVGGFPFFHIHSLSSPVQMEAKYTEAKYGLYEPFADGPWSFQNELANTFRVETLNITRPGYIESYFQQGGQRWQSLRLLNDDANVTICGVGIRSLNERREVGALPGSFECSNPLYNEIWNLGARTVQAACIEEGTARTTWDVTTDGVLLRGQQSAQSVVGAEYSNYTMSFKSNIVRGGTGWRVAVSTMSFGPTFLLTSEYAAASTFLNVNRTLVPPNTLLVGYGWNLVNQTSLETGKVNYYPLDFDLKEGEWIDIATTITEKGYIVKIGNNGPITIPLSDLQVVSNAQFSTGSVYTGTWGFGPWQDQIAYVKDVSVRAKNGSTIYTNSMSDDSILEEYGIMTNTESVCLDGAKRDRLVWSGDFAHTQRIIASSTGRTDFIKGTMKFGLERQGKTGNTAGLFAMSPAMGQAAKYTDVYKSFGLLDYQMLFLNSIARYYLDSDDNRFIEEYWTEIKSGVEVLLPLVDEYSGLLTGGTLGAFFEGDSNGTAVSALFAYNLKQMAGLAYVVGENSTAQSWTHTANKISNAVNSHLWSPELGTYSTSLTSRNVTSYIDTAWAIISGTANRTQAASAISTLSSLKLGIGYKLSSDLSDTDPSTNISPNLSGFLLEALFTYARNAPHDPAVTESVDLLLNGLWAAMITQDEYYTGTLWEYVYPDGRPGLDLFTSHAHPWGGAPTYVFPEYVLGIQPVKPGFQEWAFRPSLMHTGLSWAKGRVPGPRGTISASWGIKDEGKMVSLEVCAPRGTKGTFSIPLSAAGCSLNGEVVDSGCGESGVHLDIQGGNCSTITVSLINAITGLVEMR
ncbi:putative alpha-L-rhamnosidase C [Aspergillus stella-maris]|uniref:putative alpha-L-rhamnosidase C n=1 Tax=Aspergillus stella-maris TaxID=1810926 RepID=UPI003CCE3A61